jgi:hypothetical protein
MSNVALNMEAVEVSSDMAAKVARIADLNEVVRLADAEAKGLKAEVTEAAGGADMVALFAEGIRVTHEGVGIATVKSQTRTTISADALAEAVEALLSAFPTLEGAQPDVVAAMRALPTTAAKVTTFPVVRTK